ncbi:MAG TPA: hypothetical protein VJ438_00915 [Candidatus Nanoarchaeia archaeon]|nr:hypothetical protein [Candidatus Nanoarchaeia archaeon]
MKRGNLIIFCAIFLLLLSLAQAAKIEVSTIKEEFSAGENITLKVSLLDDSNNPISDILEIKIENAEKTRTIEKTIPANDLIEIDMGQGANHGYWNIIASYEGVTASGIFMVKMQEQAKFEINEDKLIITNLGNTKYTKTVQIIIGDTIGIRNPNLEIGESIEYRLVAPQGAYNIKVTDGTTTLIKDQVILFGTTGKAIGALDERPSERSPITGGIAPDEDEDLAFLTYVKNHKFVYVFIFVIFGAGILLAITRRYEKSKQ